MSEEVKYLDSNVLKRVNVNPARPFRIGNANFTSMAKNIFLSVASIRMALANKAFVTEVLANKKEVPLGSINYNTDNGPTDIPADAVEFTTGYNGPVVESIGLDGKVTILNKPKKAEPTPVVIDLESKKKAEEEAEAKRKKEEEEKRKAEEAKKKEEEAKAAREESDRKMREEALKKVMERENNNKKNNGSEKKTVSFNISGSAVVAEEKKEEKVEDHKTDHHDNNQQKSNQPQNNNNNQNKNNNKK